MALARVTPFAQAPLARAGIDAVLQKPVAPGQLLDCLDQLTTGHTVPPRRHPIGTPASVGRKPAPRPAGNVIPFPRAGAR